MSGNYTRFLIICGLQDPLTIPRKIKEKKPVLARDFVREVVLKRGEKP
jgi:hypothetical protein